MGHDYITGIQQIGIGVKKLRESMLTYKDLFGLNVLIFDDTSDAALMTKYTGGRVHKRRAVLTMNLAGGGGFEIWQFIDRNPQESANSIQLGDLGIYAAKIKCHNVEVAYEFLSRQMGIEVSQIKKDPAGESHFWVKDVLGNHFNIVRSQECFTKCNQKTAGVLGAIIGVSNMEEAVLFYNNFLGIDEVVYDAVDTFSDNFNEQNIYCRRVLLRKKVSGKGAFNKLLGEVEIELVQRLDGSIPDKIFNNRFWGDCGFIHICFDVLNMEGLKKYADKLNIHFTVDSHESFVMANAAGRFCYAEDPDGTLIELVETHKIPLVKKLGLYLNLKKRNRQKPLPDWMIKMLALSKVK